MWKGNSLSCFILWILRSAYYVESTCTQPSSEWSGNWYDSQFDGTFSMTWSSSVIQVTGWSVTAYSSTVTTWSCVLEDTTNNYIVFLGDQSVNLFGRPQNAYICMQWTKVTDYSFIYYLRANTEANAGSFRVFIEDAATTIGAASKYCAPTSGPSTAEYHALVKQSFITSVGQYFPTLLLGTYEYTANDGSSSLCGTGSVWDNCNDRTITAFNYTQCATVMAYSSGGILYSVYSVVSGSYTYVTLVNADATTDESTTYRFTCLISQTSGSDVQLSIDHGSCSPTGDPTTVPTGGMTATLTPYVTCPLATATTTTTTATTDTGSANIGLFVGAAIGGLLFILIIIGVIIICLKLKNKKNVVQDEEKKQAPPQGKYLPPINGGNLCIK